MLNAPSADRPISPVKLPMRRARVGTYLCRLLAVIAAWALQGFRIKNRIVRVSREGLALKPGRPPEQRALAQRNSRYGGGLYDALKIPIKLLIYIVQDPILQTLK